MSWPDPSNIQGLIARMIDYEAGARKNGVDLSCGRFRMLTAAERRVVRAELVADYIHLSGAAGKNAADRRQTLHRFCARVCDMQTPSHELLGTYLAAVDVVSAGETDWLSRAVRSSILEVLTTCVQMVGDKAQRAVAGLQEAHPYRA